MKKKFFSFILIIYFLSYKILSVENEIKLLKRIKIEIIIHGSLFSSVKNAWSKTKREWWDKEHLKNMHFNYQDRLGVVIVQTGMQELLTAHMISLEDQKIKKYIARNNNLYKDQFDEIKYFIFNWSGVLGNEDRRIASFLLYKEIRALRKKYSDAVVSIISYSHGGNVVLGMAEWVDYFDDDKFEIDFLFLMGTPIGRRTKKWAIAKNLSKKYIFKTIVNLYHQKDYIQIMDFLFDWNLNRQLIIKREHVFNIESKMLCYSKKFQELKWYNIFGLIEAKFRPYHMHFLEDDFFSNQFLDIKKRFETLDEK